MEKKKSVCKTSDVLDPLNPWCGCGEKIGLPIVSKCLKCHKHTSAYMIKSEDDPARIYIVRECHQCNDTRGTPRITSARVSIDSAYFWTKDTGKACCASGNCSSELGTNAKNPGTPNDLHTCTIVIEIVEGCNLSCPTCYANSPKTIPEHSNPMPIETFKTIVLQRIAQQGKIDIIQLSGGEPTLHPQLFEIIEWLGSVQEIDDILLNTNGVKLSDPDFLKELAAVIPKGRFSLYLQYDGIAPEGQIELRGGDFRSVREKAIEAVTDLGIPVCLTMVVTHSNLHHVWNTVERSLQNPLIKWVTFQPEFITGRNDYSKLLEEPISVAHVIHSLTDHSNGIVTGKSFIPLPCSHPNCGTVGFLVKKDNVWVPISEFVDLSLFTNFIKDRMNFDTDNLVTGCGCDDFNLDELMTNFGIKKEDIKMLFIKPFMDIRSWDEDRIQSCCTHVMLADGTLDSFCRHYANKSAAAIF